MYGPGDSSRGKGESKILILNFSKELELDTNECLTITELPRGYLDSLLETAQEAPTILPKCALT